MCTIGSGSFLLSLGSDTRCKRTVSQLPRNMRLHRPASPSIEDIVRSINIHAGRWLNIYWSENGKPLAVSKSSKSQTRSVINTLFWTVDFPPLFVSSGCFIDLSVIDSIN
jgi:hypothetical protein